MIAITGKYGSGKTTFLKKIASYGYKVLNCDEFITKCYQKNNLCYLKIKETLGNDFVNEKHVLKDKLREFIVEKPDNINIIEKLVYPILEQHLIQNTYDFVEIANIQGKNIDFSKYFTKIYVLVTPEKQRQQNIQNKNVDKLVKNINNSLNIGNVGKKTVNILWEDINKTGFFETFFKNAFDL
ncbi:dephospho-CoA kinase [Mesomycoplasma neurolyticum]|uniref:Dephospho-CoA kinase n=1 Tax=Mesomycoplasma neurolyticum TaxID=2120 RepID=A0A449A642_9BACT|nr:dephospho-CoA kinase [Mesomycoplasma neurolyticum]VEU59706.1 putative dephospho-CoA kinase [Mesomycoplasma neurolyticum]